MNWSRMRLSVAAIALVAFAMAASGEVGGCAPAPGPTLTVTPDRGLPGETFVVSGIRFPPGRVKLHVEDDGGNIVADPAAQATINASAEGSFSYSLSVPSAAPLGRYWVIALYTDQPQTEWNDLMQRGADAPLLLSASGETLTVTPATGHPGSAIWVSGGGWEPNAVLSETLFQRDGKAIHGAAIRADSEGSFKVQLGLHEPLTAGGYVVYVEDIERDTHAVASSGFLIAGAQVQLKVVNRGEAAAKVIAAVATRKLTRTRLTLDFQTLKPASGTSSSLAVDPGSTVYLSSASDDPTLRIAYVTYGTDPTHHHWTDPIVVTRDTTIGVYFYRAPAPAPAGVQRAPVEGAPRGLRPGKVSTSP